MNQHAKHDNVVWWTSMLSTVMQCNGPTIFAQTNERVWQFVHEQKKGLTIYTQTEERSENLYTDMRKDMTIYTQTEEIERVMPYIF